MIEARSLTKHYGALPVLENVSFQIGRGEHVALLGLNGTGKTTLIRCLLGITPFEGDLLVAGQSVRRANDAVRARSGYVPQRPPLFDGSLAEVVDFFARLRNASSQAVERRLRDFGLPLDTNGQMQVRDLSGGMLQKVLLALALAADVELLLLDEPTANLDARARSEFLDALRQINDETTIVLASHRLSDVQQVADRLIVLHDSDIAFDGSMEELRKTVGLEDTLWIKIPVALKERALYSLRMRCPFASTISNGAAIGVRADPRAWTDVLLAIRAAGIAVDDLRPEAQSLNGLLERILSTGASASGESC